MGTAAKSRHDDDGERDADIDQAGRRQSGISQNLAIPRVERCGHGLPEGRRQPHLVQRAVNSQNESDHEHT